MNRSYPPSCCSPDIIEHVAKSKPPTASAVMNRNDDGTTFTIQIKNNSSDLNDPWNHVASETKGDEIKAVAVCTAIYQQVIFNAVKISICFGFRNLLAEDGRIEYPVGFSVIEKIKFDIIQLCVICLTGHLNYPTRALDLNVPE